MSKSKKQTEFQQINDLASHYKKFTNEQLVAFMSRAALDTPKKYRVAVKNELKKRGITVD